MDRSVTVAALAVDSAPVLLDWLRAHGFELAVEGGRLRICPADRVTPELRDAIARHKVELLQALAPIKYVTFRGGLTLPLPALQLAWDLENRGFRLSLNADDQIVIEPQAALTPADRTAVNRWRLQLRAIVGYQAPEVI